MHEIQVADRNWRGTGIVWVCLLAIPYRKSMNYLLIIFGDILLIQITDLWLDENPRTSSIKFLDS